MGCVFLLFVFVIFIFSFRSESISGAESVFTSLIGIISMLFFNSADDLERIQKMEADLTSSGMHE